MYARVPDTGDGADRVSSQRQRYPRGRGPDGSNSNHRQHRSTTSSVAFTTDSSAPGTSSGSVPLATVGRCYETSIFISFLDYWQVTLIWSPYGDASLIRSFTYW